MDHLTEHSLDHPRTLLASFAARAKNDPDRIALIAPETGERSTYAELAVRAATLARRLREAGLKPGDRVAVRLPRGTGAVIAVFGILWAGCVYVPVSPTQPADRFRLIIDQGDILAVVTNESHVQEELRSVPLVFDIDLVLKDALPAMDVALEELHNADPDESAYIIFTSGSTGVPKGVEIAHSSAWNTIQVVLERYGFCEEDCALAVSALDFDLSVFDLFGLLSVGGRLVLLDDAISKDAAAWVGLVEEHRVSVWNSVPALLEMLCVALPTGRLLPHLRLVLVSGDWVRPHLFHLYRQLNPEGRFVALGGATEASIWSNACEVDVLDPSWSAVPYGRPLDGQCYRIVLNGQDCDTGVAGELWIGGRGLAKGYAGDPERTAASFVIDRGERWYRTGDLGWYMPDGQIMFGGRADRQVKINGFRVELGEIEHALSGLPGVESPVALAVDNGGSRSLVAVLSRPPLNTDAIGMSEHERAGAELAYDWSDPLTQVVYQFLKELTADLDGLGIPASGEAVLDLWRRFIDAYEKSGRQPESAGHDGRAEALDDGRAEDLARLLTESRALFGDILTGRTPALALLEHPALSPEAMMKARGAAENVAGRVSQLLEKYVGKEGKELRVALLFGGRGLLYRPLIQALAKTAGRPVRFLYFETSEALLRTARENLEFPGLDIRFIKTDRTWLDSRFAGQADAVIAYNVLHTFHDLSVGLSWATTLLANDGRLFAFEAPLLTAEGLISAAVIEEGFIRCDEARRAQGSPFLTPVGWRQRLEKAGLELVVTENEKEGDLFALVAAPKNETVVGREAIRAFCEERLVSYMVPEEYIYATSLPLTTNGKVDVKALTGWFSGGVKETRRIVPPQTDTERALVEIWAGLLQTDQISREDPFFEIGGDSLLATRLISALGASFNVRLKMRDLLEGPILYELAARIDEERAGEDMEEGEL